MLTTPPGDMLNENGKWRENCLKIISEYTKKFVAKKIKFEIEDLIHLLISSLLQNLIQITNSWENFDPKKKPFPELEKNPGN